MSTTLNRLAARIYCWLLSLEAGADQATVERQVELYCEEAATRADTIAVLSFLDRLLEDKQPSEPDAKDLRGRIRKIIL